MFKSQTLRDLVNERLSAAAEEIFALFERTLAEYEEELRRSKEQSQRKRELLDSNPTVVLIRNSPVTVNILQLKQKEEHLRASVQESRVCVKTEEDPERLEQAQTELREEKQGEELRDTDGDSDTKDEALKALIRCSGALESQNYQVTAAQNSLVSLENESVDFGDASGTKKTHQCSFCTRIFGKKVDLQRHIRVHTGEKPYCCLICKKEFSRKDNLVTHRKSHTREKRRSKTVPESYVCVKSEEEPEGYEETQTGQTQGEDISAETYFHEDTEEDVKDEDLRALMSYSDAQAEAKDAYNYQIQISAAQNSGTSLENMFVNAEDASGTKKKHQCSFCTKIFSQKVDLQRHIRVHTGEKPYRCSICKKAFSRKDNLITHRKSHTREKQRSKTGPESCVYVRTDEEPEGYEQTQTEQTQGEDISAETYFHTDIEEDVKDEALRGLIGYSDAQAEAKEIYNYQIQIPAAQNSGTSLENMFVNAEDASGTKKKHQCSFCTKIFSQKVDLQRHFRVHTGEKPYRCSICKKEFSRNDNLITHRKLHTGEKPYSCQTCEKSFTTNRRLKLHVREHT